MQRRPAEARSDGGLVEFALDHVLRAAVIEAEDLVVDVETIHDKRQAVVEAHATLRIELKVGIEEVVTGWPVSGIPVTGNVFSIVGKSQAHREATAIIGGADVPGVRRVPHEPRMIRTGEIGSKGSARCRIAVVCGDSETAERARQEGEVLQIGKLETVEPSAAAFTG